MSIVSIKVELPENVGHAYDDDAYSGAVIGLYDAIYALWEAGANAAEIQGEIDAALRNLA